MLEPEDKSTHRHPMAELKKDSLGRPVLKSPQPMKKDFAKRLRLVKGMLCRGLHRWEIKAICAEQWKMRRKSVDRYITRARKQLIEETGKDKDELRSESYAFYMSVLQNEEADIRDKIKARIAADKLLALPLPQLLQIQGTIEQRHRHEIEITIAQQLTQCDPRERDAILSFARRVGLESNGRKSVTR